VARPPKVLVLQIAAEMLGGRRKLRGFLRASSADLASWLAGTKQPPEQAFLKALELILDDLDAGGRRLSKISRARRESAVVLKARREKSPR
jgi:hypothetical protein